MLRKIMAFATFAVLMCGCASSPSPRYCPYCGADLSKPPQHTSDQAKSQPASPVASSAVASTPAAAPATPAAVTATDTSHVYQMAPAKLFEAAQAALKADGFVIDSATDGVIQTGWRAYEGEFHVFRRWQEQSRFRVTVVPDINNPTGVARISISEETQRRSNELANWEAASARPEREAQVLKSLEARIGK